MLKRILAAFMLGTGCGAIAAWAAVPQPDVVLYGELRVNGQLITAADTDGDGVADADVTVIARVNPGSGDQEVGRYRIGAQLSAGNNYALRIRMESLADGTAQSADRAIRGQTVSLYIRDARNPANVTETLAATYPSGGATLTPGTIDMLALDTTGGPAACACADFDGNNLINLTDFTMFAVCFGHNAPSDTCAASAFVCGDLNADGIINLSDFTTFATIFSLTPDGVVPPNCLSIN